ncbi:MAG: hypothetical protein ACR2P0_07345 [Acidimicrobiales bacterium]
MNPSRTLAERFRTQRTDRILLAGDEVLSLIEKRIDEPVEVEVLIESDRTDIEQALWLDVDADGDSRIDAFRMGGFDEPVATIRLEPGWLRIWNAWMIDELECAWTGNHGIIVETLPCPDGAISRMRLWCSDGLGDPSFDDLVAVVTFAIPAIA